METATLSRIALLRDKHPELGIDVASFDRLEGREGVNTKLSYFYRDVNNYKQHTEVVLAGAITAQQIETILAHLDEDGGFIPGQVGLDDLQPRMTGGYDADMDHPFHDINGIELTEEPEFGGPDVADLVATFQAVSWDQEYRPE